MQSCKFHLLLASLSLAAQTNHFKSKEASKPILYEKHKLSQNRLQNQF